MNNKKTILVVDDSAINREVLSDMLYENYKIILCEDGEEEIDILNSQRDNIDLILLDIIMRKMNGIDVLKIMQEKGWIDHIPVIIVSADINADTIRAAYQLGAADYIARPFDESIVLKRVENVISMYMKQKKLVNLVTDQIYENEKNSNLMVAILSHIVEFRNSDSRLHVTNIKIITEILLNRLREKANYKYKLSFRDISLISLASALHDIGKMAIPDEILNKPGSLTPEEFEVIKTHSEIGSSMLEDVPVDQGEQLLKYSYEITRWHHERYDGKGYPDGLKGDEIPISAQVVSIADVYDALTSNRVYKKASSHEEAMRMILTGECGKFNPILVECLVEAEHEIYNTLHNSKPSPFKKQGDIINKIQKEAQTNSDFAYADGIMKDISVQREMFTFYWDNTDDYIFEINYKPQILMLSKKIAELLGLDDMIVNPFSDDKVEKAIGLSQIKKIVSILENQNRVQPNFVDDIEFTINGVKKAYKVTAKALWSPNDVSNPTTIIGKIHIN